MNDTSMSDHELEIMKRSVDDVEFDEDNMDVVAEVTDYGVTVFQRFPVTIFIDKLNNRKPLLGVDVEDDGWATTYEGKEAGKASHQAYKEVREWVLKNDRRIIESCETMGEYRSSN